MSGQFVDGGLVCAVVGEEGEDRFDSFGAGVSLIRAAGRSEEGEDHVQDGVFAIEDLGEVFAVDIGLESPVGVGDGGERVVDDGSVFCQIAQLQEVMGFGAVPDDPAGLPSVSGHVEVGFVGEEDDGLAGVDGEGAGGGGEEVALAGVDADGCELAEDSEAFSAVVVETGTDSVDPEADGAFGSGGGAELFFAVDGQVGCD